MQKLPLWLRARNSLIRLLAGRSMVILNADISLADRPESDPDSWMLVDASNILVVGNSWFNPPTGKRIELRQFDYRPHLEACNHGIYMDGSSTTD